MPAAEVMARDDVLGMVTPRAATMGTTTSVVLLPGSPPMQCLSITGVRSHTSRSPTSTMARVSATVSAWSIALPVHRVMSEARWMSGTRPRLTSSIKLRSAS